MKIDYDHWRELSLWPLDCACKLVFGEDPHTTPSDATQLPHKQQPEWAKCFHIAVSAIKGGELIAVLPGLEVKPSVFVEWAKPKVTAKDYAIPDQLADLAIDKPLTPTERDTLLIIIAALCEHLKIEHQARGAPTKIAKLTEELGYPVTDDTVRKWIGRIPDALRNRAK